MNKRLLQTFAAGMIASTTVLTITFYLGGYHKPTTLKADVTDADVISYLEKNEQVAISKQEYDQLVKEQNDEKKQTNVKKEKPVEETPKETDEQTESNKKEEQPKEQPKQEEEKKEQPKAVSITIKEGMATSDVSNLLESAGVIKSSSEFSKYLIEHEYHTRVQIGTFEVKNGMSFYELAEAITR
ncbi:endolytic transglycosylase MltG [Bacillus sp. FJAT-47783]|uniref:endolytic transglycosylase MltG n=1 Tax=Bacillus sp. FJAT-47783 TaxID=2922712 RepID=UPI001FACB80C|nr:endolytic transglycosylase MltG [Bacillus sp. FJAT-47783]